MLFTIHYDEPEKKKQRLTQKLIKIYRNFILLVGILFQTKKKKNCIKQQFVIGILHRIKIKKITKVKSRTRTFFIVFQRAQILYRDYKI